MTNLVFIGPPGSGKGTQADILSHNKSNFLKISAGDLLREEAARETNLGEEINSYIKEGNLVPDELVLDVISNLIELNLDKNLIFDGFPRRVSQAEKLDKKLEKLGLKLDAVVSFSLSSEILYERICNRRICSKCKASFSVKEENFSVFKCVYCGGENFFVRDDDKREIFEKRMRIYREENFRILEYYRNFVKIFVVEAENKIDEITKNIENFVLSI